MWATMNTSFEFYFGVILGHLSENAIPGLLRWGSTLLSQQPTRCDLGGESIRPGQQVPVSFSGASFSLSLCTRSLCWPHLALQPVGETGPPRLQRLPAGIPRLSQVCCGVGKVSLSQLHFCQMLRSPHHCLLRRALIWSFQGDWSYRALQPVRSHRPIWA